MFHPKVRDGDLHIYINKSFKFFGFTKNNFKQADIKNVSNFKINEN